MELTRRNFIATTAIAAGAATVAGTTRHAMAEEASEDFDIVVVGGGMGGLTAAVQAALNGASVILLEKCEELGLGGAHAEGQFGVGSRMQQEAGIDFTIADVVAHEMELAQFRSSGSLWLDLCQNSAGNLDWCEEQGVVYENVDDYFGTCALATFHWFKNHNAMDGYITPMIARAEELGVEIRTQTAATELIIDNGVVKGVKAEGADGTTESINAKAVILATGGVAGDFDLLAKQGWTPSRLALGGVSTTVGDGYKLAQSAGNKSLLEESCSFIQNYIPAMGFEVFPQFLDPINGMITGLAAGGCELWVDQDGRRFWDESTPSLNMMYQTMPTKDNKASYVVFDQSMYEDLYAETEGAAERLASCVESNEGNSLFKADTIEGLAEAVGIDADNLVAAVERYNQMCEAGEDTDFYKDTDKLVAINAGPYYIGRIEQLVYCSIGGISVDKDFQCIDANWEKIPGLYSAGIDCAMLYRAVYTITLGGSCSAGVVNSGRGAANAACASFQA